VLDIPGHQEKRFKVPKGRIIHEDKQRINPNYLREKLGVKEKKTEVYLAVKFSIRGVVGEILFLNDGTARLEIACSTPRISSTLQTCDKSEYVNITSLGIFLAGSMLYTMKQKHWLIIKCHFSGWKNLPTITGHMMFRLL